METTFLIARQFNVTPFEIMAQDIDEVIFVINYMIESSHADAGGENMIDNTIDEKEQDRSFWACF